MAPNQLTLPPTFPVGAATSPERNAPSKLAGDTTPSEATPVGTGDGHIEIIANGKPIVTVKGPIGHADKGLGMTQYFKFGPYRAGHTNEWTLYYDYFRRSPFRGDVVR